MTTTTTTTTLTPRTWWKWNQAPAGALVYHLDDGSPCPACGGALRVTHEEQDVGGNPVAQDLECSACTWGQGFDVHGFVWARRP
jgi:hypothetical protein